MVFSWSVLANEDVSCDDLIDVANSSEEVRNSLTEIEIISEGDEVDSALGELIDALLDFAELEDNDVLQEHINTMDQGWEAMDGELLMNGLNGAIGSLDTLISNDCD